MKAFIFLTRHPIHIKSRRISWTVRVARMELMRNAYKISVGKHEGKGPLRDIDGRNNIKMELQQK